MSFLFCFVTLILVFLFVINQYYIIVFRLYDTNLQYFFIQLFLANFFHLSLSFFISSILILRISVFVSNPLSRAWSSLCFISSRLMTLQFTIFFYSSELISISGYTCYLSIYEILSTCYTVNYLVKGWMLN